MDNKKFVISIGRECGSGGHEIGEKLAEHYGVKLYDRNVIEILAEQSNQSPDELAKLEEKVTGHILPFRRGFVTGEQELMNKMSKSDQLFLRERALIRSLAETESCVIVGRAANSILTDMPNVLRLYVYAPEAFKIPRVKAFYHLDTDQQAKKKMEQLDKARRAYFQYYSDMIWGSSDGHDFMVNSGTFGIDGTVEIITKLAERKLQNL